MLMTIVLLGICQIIGSICTLCLGMVLLDRWAERKQKRIEAQLMRAVHDWVDAQPANEKGEVQPSKLAVAASMIGAVVGSAAAKSLMASVKQDASSVSKVAGGLADQLEAQSNPIMALMGGGKRGKGAAVMRLAEMLGPMFGGKSNGNGSGTTGTEYTGRRHRD